jgi:hypothetical protein
MHGVNTSTLSYVFVPRFIKRRSKFIITFQAMNIAVFWNVTSPSLRISLNVRRPAIFRMKKLERIFLTELNMSFSSEGYFPSSSSYLFLRAQK